MHVVAGTGRGRNVMKRYEVEPAVYEKAKLDDLVVVGMQAYKVLSKSSGYVIDGVKYVHMDVKKVGEDAHRALAVEYSDEEYQSMLEKVRELKGVNKDG
jgi:hypothetical protein